MTPEELLTTLRQRGVVVGVQAGELGLDAPEGAVDEAMRGAIRRHKPALMVLVAAGWWPADRPKPNVLDLAVAHGADRVREAFAELGSDLVADDSSWEVLFVVAERLAAEAGRRTTRRAAVEVKCGGEPFEVPPAFRLKRDLGWSTERFSSFCRRVLGRPGPASAEDDAFVAETMRREGSSHGA